MTGDEFQAQCATTRDPGLSRDSLILNAALGMSGESGEFADHVKKHLFQGQPWRFEDLLVEVGDVLWYVAEACDGLGVSMDVVMQVVLEKLKKRYPFGYTPGGGIRPATVTEAAQRMLDAHDRMNDYGQDGSPEEMGGLFRAYNEAADGLRESLR